MTKKKGITEQQRKEYEEEKQFTDPDDRALLGIMKKTKDCGSLNIALRDSKIKAGIQQVNCNEKVDEIKSAEYKKWYKEQGYECTEAQKKAKLVELGLTECAKKNCGCEYPKKNGRK